MTEAERNFITRICSDLLRRPAGEETAGRLAALTDRARIAGELLASAEYRAVAVHDLFEIYLRRPPDPQGHAALLSMWEAGATRERLAAVLITSDEYFSKVAAGRNESFVHAVYEDLLHRAADANALVYWTELLDGGVPRTSLVDRIMDSPEFHRARIDKLYRAYLGRNAGDFDAGGTEEVLRAILSSDEYVERAQEPGAAARPVARPLSAMSIWQKGRWP